MLLCLRLRFPGSAWALLIFGSCSLRRASTLCVCVPREMPRRWCGSQEVSRRHCVCVSQKKKKVYQLRRWYICVSVCVPQEVSRFYRVCIYYPSTGSTSLSMHLCSPRGASTPCNTSPLLSPHKCPEKHPRAPYPTTTSEATACWWTTSCWVHGSRWARSVGTSAAPSLTSTTPMSLRPPSPTWTKTVKTGFVRLGLDKLCPLFSG